MKYIKVTNEEKNLTYFFNNKEAFSLKFDCSIREIYRRMKNSNFKISKGWKSGAWMISEVSFVDVDKRYLFEVKSAPDKKKSKFCLCGCKGEIKRSGDEYLEKCWYKELTGKEKPESGFFVSDFSPEITKIKI